MELFSQAISSAHPVWLQAVRQVGWHHAVITLLYLAAAWLCYLHARWLSDDLQSPTHWLALTGVLCLLAANTVLQGEVWFTHTLRALAHATGWYESRRPWQYLITVLLVGLAWAGTRWLGAGLAHPGANQSQLALGLALGVALLLLLVPLRAVSAHGTDALLGLRLLGLSLGRLCELAGLGLVLMSTWRSLQIR